MTQSTIETATGLRLVRCPKCENLLPELADYSLYQCGGCGAVLQAKHQTIDTPDALSDKLNEERDCEPSANSHNSLQKGVVGVSDVTVLDSNSVANSLSCTASLPENPNLLGYAEKSGNASGVENRLNGGKKKGDEPDYVVERKRENLSSPMEYSGESWRSGRMNKWHTREKSAMENLQTSIRHDVQGTHFSGSNYSHDGPSSSYSDTLYNNREPMMNYNHIAGASRVQYGEQDRAELLKKLDELKDQVIRSCEVTSKPKENIPVINPSMQYFQPDRHASALPPYYSHCPEPFRYEGPSNSFYPPPPPPQPLKPDHNIGYGDTFEPHLLRRPSHQVPRMYQQPPPHPYFSGQYVDPSSDILHNTPFHQSSCSCFLCYTKNERGSAPVPSTGFGNKRFSSVPYNAMQYHHENPPIFEPSFQNSRRSNPPLRNLHAHPDHNRWPSDINSEMNDIDLHHAQKLVLPIGGNFCNPVAGAAPFLTCFNCFELLQLPKKLLLTLAKQKKMRCGACSTIIKFSIIDKKVIFSSNSEKMCNPSIIDDDDVLKNRGNTYGHVSQFSANFSSDDNEFSQVTDREPILMSKVQDSDSSNPQEMQTFHSSSPVTSEDDNIPKVLIRRKEVINSIQQPIKTSFSSPKDPDSPLQENFTGSVANNHAVNRFGKGNRSSRSDQENGDISKTIMRQNSMKETSLATETEMSFNDYSNTGVSQDSRDTDVEREKYSNNKSSESFFANIIKRGFSKSNSTDERGKSNVSVNGHFILERIVKKAEKLAGPIRPGQYWYDFRAGFWGVIGGPCLGIIPPHIEAFNYPMPENCAGGSTGIFVNGRELNVKDLDLLSSRGLPTDKDRSYIIDISGKVRDEDTGEELDCLGRLAPTVEKLKHGFGMKVPKSG